MGHAGKLWDVEWLFPLQPSLGKHLQHRLDQFRAIQAAKSHKDSTGETVQIVSKQASAAVRAEVAIEPLARFSDIVERLRLAAEEREILFWHTKESRRRATRGLFAVVAMASRDKCRICIEFELNSTTGALRRVFLAHVFHLKKSCAERSLRIHGAEAMSAPSSAHQVFLDKQGDERGRTNDFCKRASQFSSLGLHLPHTGSK